MASAVASASRFKIPAQFVNSYKLLVEGFDPIFEQNKPTFRLNLVKPLFLFVLGFIIDK